MLVIEITFKDGGTYEFESKGLHAALGEIEDHFVRAKEGEAEVQEVRIEAVSEEGG